MSFPIRKIVVHCSATPNGKPFTAIDIDRWHQERGFKRNPNAVRHFNSDLAHIGYHFVIELDGSVKQGRQVGEIGAHVRGHNRNSVGICLIGGVGEGDERDHARFTSAQWHALHILLRQLEAKYPHAKVYGHRDLSPDLNGDGSIQPSEWLKTCPNFDVWDWLDSETIINELHLLEEK